MLGKPMKVLTWNVNRAGESRTELWKFLQSEDADIVLLQEVIGIPRWIWKHYQCFSISPRYYEGGNAAYSTAVLSKGPIDATPYLSSELEWVNKIYTEHPGWIIGCETTLSTGEQFRVISVHLLAKSVPRELWADVDVSGIKLTNNPDIWLTEILYALLSTSKVADGTNWIVAGDFNSSVKFDFSRGQRKPRDRISDGCPRVDRLPESLPQRCRSHVSKPEGQGCGTSARLLLRERANA